MIDLLPKAPLDPTKFPQESGARSVADWIEILNDIQSELPEPFAIIDVLQYPDAELVCKALRALKRNPRIVQSPNPEALTRLWNICPALQRLPSPSTALDLGCGAGRDSVWLAANGWDVTSVDRLATNLESLAKLHAKYAPNHTITTRQANLNDYQPEPKFDLVLLHYCWDSNYFELAKKCVAPNGRLSILAHTQTHRDCFGNPRQSKILNPTKLDRSGFETISEQEYWLRDRHSVSIVLQRH